MAVGKSSSDHDRGMCTGSELAPHRLTLFGQKGLAETGSGPAESGPAEFAGERLSQLCGSGGSRNIGKDTYRQGLRRGGDIASRQGCSLLAYSERETFTRTGALSTGKQAWSSPKGVEGQQGNRQPTRVRDGVVELSSLRGRCLRGRRWRSALVPSENAANRDETPGLVTVRRKV